MSRRLRRSVEVQCDGRGVPAIILMGRASLPVYGVVDGWREWFGAVFGEPERDVWIVDTPQGVYELHCVRFPGEEHSKELSADDQTGREQGQWVMERAED